MTPYGYIVGDSSPEALAGCLGESTPCSIFRSSSFIRIGDNCRVHQLTPSIEFYKGGCVCRHPGLHSFDSSETAGVYRAPIWTSLVLHNSQPELWPILSLGSLQRNPSTTGDLFCYFLLIIHRRGMFTHGSSTGWLGGQYITAANCLPYRYIAEQTLHTKIHS